MPLMFTAERNDLLEGLERCAPAADERVAHPFSGMVLLAVDTELRLRATNLVVAVDTAVPAEVKVAHPTAVNFKRLRAALAVMPVGRVKVSFDKGWRLTVSCAGARQYTLAGLNGADFPQTPAPDPETVTARLEAGPELARAVRRVRHAIVNVKDRPFLDGMEISVREGQLSACAMSGPTLALTQCPLDQPDTTLFMPSQVLTLAEHQLGTGRVQISQDARTIYLQTEQTLVCAQLPSGSFPPWRAIVESLKPEEICRAPGPLTIDVLRAVAAARTEADAPVHLLVKDNTMEVSVAHEDCSGRDVIPVEATGTIDVLVNPLYFLETIRAADAHYVLARAEDHLVIRTDDGFLGVVARVVK